MKIDTYQHNGLNRRVLKVTSSETRGFWYNRNWQCVEERVGDFSLLHMRYCWGLRYVDDLIFRECDSKTTPDGNINQRLYALHDANWNIVAMGANAGTPHERFTYNAFGTVNCFSGTFGTKASALYTTRFFTGQVLDSETGLMLYRNRIYHPTLGRFLQRDPIGYEAEDENLYRYVGNNPTTMFDPTGLQQYGDDGQGISIKVSDFYIYKNNKNTCYSVTHTLSNFNRKTVSVTTGSWINDWRNRKNIARYKAIAESLPMPGPLSFTESADCNPGYCCKNRKQVKGSKKGVKGKIEISDKPLSLTYKITINYTCDHSWDGWAGNCEKE